MSLVPKNLPPFPPIPDLSPEVQAYFRDVAVYLETQLKQHNPNLTAGSDPGHIHTFGLPATLHADVHESGGADPISHDDLTDFVANEHINHAGVSIIAGTNLNGGGAITANRTLNLDASPSVTSLTAGTLTIAAGSIIDSGGTIDIGAFGAGNNVDVNILFGDTTLSDLYAGTLRLLDSVGETNYLQFVSAGTELTVDRALSIDVGNAARTITLSGNPTLGDWFDQSVKTTATPTFPQVNFDDVDVAYIDVDTGNFNILSTATSNNIFLGTVSGSVLLGEGKLGITGDTDLLQLAANVLTVNGSIAFSNLLSKVNDTDTFISFATPDRLSFSAGGLEFLRLSEIDKGSDEFTVNEAGVDIDFRVEAIGQTNALFVQGSDGAVGIGTATPSEKLDVDGRIELTQQSGSTNDGALWNDSTQEALQTFVSGIEQTLAGVIFTQTADQTIANTTTETTHFGTGVGTLTLPANFWTVGKTIRIEIHGDMADTGNPTAEVQAYYGATSLIDSGAITLSGLAGTEEWETEVVITCRSVGATGTVETIIDWEYETTTGSSAIERLDVAGALQTIDTTASGVLDVTFQWGTAAAANTLHSHVAFVEILN